MGTTLKSLILGRKGTAEPDSLIGRTLQSQTCSDSALSRTPGKRRTEKKDTAEPASALHIHTSLQSVVCSYSAMGRTPQILILGRKDTVARITVLRQKHCHITSKHGVEKFIVTPRGENKNLYFSRVTEALTR